MFPSSIVCYVFDPSLPDALEGDPAAAVIFVPSFLSGERLVTFHGPYRFTAVGDARGGGVVSSGDGAVYPSLGAWVARVREDIANEAAGRAKSEAETARREDATAYAAAAFRARLTELEGLAGLPLAPEAEAAPAPSDDGGPSTGYAGGPRLGAFADDDVPF